ncbi:class I SAM-dependent methyltransferase [Streptomyces sp. NPDC001941]|uniref:class I SAM-dependent methyltransferase n=1 Tax=Streptomyces sp. NPDC001941 TaxID=3154659 RepID=UPI00331C7A7F
MFPTVRTLVRTTPSLHDEMWAGLRSDVPQTIGRISTKYLGSWPQSILHVGSGTGRDLSVLARHVDECAGVDVRHSMIQYAKECHPGLTFHQVDLCTFDLWRQFHVVSCMDMTLSALHHDEDFDRALGRLYAHTHVNGYMVLELVNRPAALAHDLPRTFTFRQLAGAAQHRYLGQKLVREIVWRTATGDGDEVHDHVEFRTTTAEEGLAALERHRFSVLDVFDNRNLEGTSGQGWSLVFVTQKTA